MKSTQPEAVRDVTFIDPPKIVDNELILHLEQTVSADHEGGFLPFYKFKMMHVTDKTAMGEINLRIGYTDNVMFYRGNIGFTVYEAFRGRRYAERSCRLLVPLIRHHGLYPVWLTCNIDNEASRRAIENLGAIYVETRVMPEDFPYAAYYPVNARVKRRYCWKVEGL